MSEPQEITRWNVGKQFEEALFEAAQSEDMISAAMKPVKAALDDLWDGFRSDIMDRLPGAISDEIRYRTDKIIEALLHGDEKLLGSYIAAGGYRQPDIGWDGRLRSGYWVDVRRKIVEANERVLEDERIADLTAERDALVAELVEAREALACTRTELAEAKDSLHWANVRIAALSTEPADAERRAAE